MGLARAQPALGPGPGDRAGAGGPPESTRSPGPRASGRGTMQGTPPAGGGPATLPGTVAGAKQLGEKGGGNTVGECRERRSE